MEINRTNVGNTAWIATQVSITLPLLLLDSLKRSGAFNQLFNTSDEVDSAIKRARAYYLINALVQSLVKFSIAPTLMGETTDRQHRLYENIGSEDEDQDTDPLAGNIERPGESQTSTWKKNIIGFFNPPLLAASAAFVLGIVPPLHSLFFEKGRVLTNTFTQSLYKLGDLYATVQVFILGAQLARAHPRYILDLKSTHALSAVFQYTDDLPPKSLDLLMAIRRWKPDLFMKDPMLDYVLMMASVGPPTTNVAAFAELAGVSEDTANSVAYMLFVSYFTSPLMSIPITGSIALISAYKDLYT
ncbi:hypothetical protein Clacol_003581 [Clathrus columnatus]|uniref:Uncharacterized protein n=1 Tax=Clathrus columnatus TaxID=1419009 RepID=A0AAV5A3Z0_9AGAM|nr:hypothetical protein Clacol_003581 [Clathrus columnatus]